MKSITFILLTIVLSGCSKPNSKPTFGETGLPKNCRAIIQTNINEYRKIRSSGENYEIQMADIDGVLDSIERNCGENGYSWDYK
ncbi:hypothetical protein [Acinetobacter sp. 243_ASPC]|uniref:hypothetical protein n=1 Tax=Acinetobacter sp. 243_ASPC TaxID=1579345 RepID=UPI0006613171|nr:hypothetical protein [Acinetobacter sp. 243_ASPC]